jgi:hypothetical protein
LVQNFYSHACSAVRGRPRRSFFSAESELGSAIDCDQHSEQQKPQPPEQEAEGVSEGGEHSVDGIAA